MSNGQRFILLVGSIIVAVLWLRVLAVSAFPLHDDTELSIADETIDIESLYLEKAEAELQVSKVINKICTTGNGAPVNCSDIDENTMCINVRGGAQSGIRIDCNTNEPIPVDDYGAPGAGGAKYRSTY